MGEYTEKLIELYESNVSKPGLIRVRELLKRLGNPQNGIKCVHVAGTNGKGSTCAYIEAVLRNAGYKTAMFTSPHIYDLREHIKIDNQMISEEKLEEHSKAAFEITEKMESDGFDAPTFFETMTAMAFDYMSDCEIDIAVIETGMGGENDATNIIYPILSVITHISLDHTAFLGNTLSKIAIQKAGIIKSGVPLVLAPNQDIKVKSVMKKRCKAKASNFIDASDYKIEIYDMELNHTSFSAKSDKEYYRFKLSAVGRHQTENAVTALCAIEELNKIGFEVGYTSIKKGINSTKIDSRIEVLEEEKIIFDASHNPDSVRELADALSILLPEERFVLITSALKTKDIASMAFEYKKFADYAYLTKANNPLHASKSELIKAFQKNNIEFEYISDKEDLVKAAKEKCEELNSYLVVSGTFYIIADVKKALGLIT